MTQRFYRVIDEHGNEIKPGDEITDFRGDKVKFDMVTRGPEYNGTAKVAYTGKEMPSGRIVSGECYAQVFGLTVEAWQLQP